MEEFYHELSKSIRKEILIDDLNKTLEEFRKALRLTKNNVRRIPFSSFDSKEEIKYLNKMIKALEELITWYTKNY